METKTKKFHFQEMDWIISFPEAGNQGRKYLYYSVSFLDRKQNYLEEKVCLVDILEKPEFENNYPHTVGFFKEQKETTKDEMTYMEIRIIRSMDEFWKYLNDLDL
jgi:hypothetical protein